MQACNQEKVNEVTQDNEPKTNASNTTEIEKINYDSIAISSLNITEPDSLFINLINNTIEKDNKPKTDSIWEFLNKNNRPIAEVYVSYAYYMNADRTRNDEAIALYKKAIELKPNYALPHKIIGNIYIHYNMLPDALFYMNKAHEIAPKDVEVINNIANIYFVEKDYEIAESFYTKAIEIAPNEVVYGNRALCYDNLGKPMLAQQDRIQAEAFKNK